MTEREKEGRNMGNRKHRKFGYLPGEEEEEEGEEACKEIRAWLLVVHGLFMALYLNLRFLFSCHRSFEPPAERIGGENIGNQMLKVMREN